MDTNTFWPFAAIVIGLASYVLGCASQYKRIARDFVPLTRARFVLGQLVLDYRDIVHQYRHGRVIDERADIANSMAGILLRLDPGSILNNQWVVEKDPSGVEDFIGRVTRGIERYGSLSEQRQWASVLEERKPLMISRMAASMMQPGEQHATSRGASGGADDKRAQLAAPMLAAQVPAGANVAKEAGADPSAL